MLSLSSAQVALNEILRQRLVAAGCQYGRFDVSEPGACISLSGQKSSGKTLFFWEFSCVFHQLVGAYLSESYDENTAQLTILIDVANEQFQYSRTTKQQQKAQAEAEKQQAIERRQALNRQIAD